MPVVLPIHPRTRKKLAATGLDQLVPAERLRMIDPVGYLDMVALEKDARAILTDSGGVQKEAYFFSVPCVTIRGETEWVELVECGANQLAPPTSVESLVEAAMAAVTQTRTPPAGLYGDGAAAEAIARRLTLGR
jgi:UDP-GlcNAc3NAcA epimerase